MAARSHRRGAFGGRGRRAGLAAGAATVALGTAAAVPTLASGSEPVPVSLAQPVGRVTYDLGDQAFVPGAPYEGKSELAAVVHYPTASGTQKIAPGRHPLIVVQHGLWATCADRPAQSGLKKAEKARAAAEKAGDKAEEARQQKIVEKMNARLWAWPCRPGVAPLPSASGYDYLAKKLARQGFVVVSMGANGINATSGGQAPAVYEARARLIDRHLGMWSQLAADKGPLKSKLKDARTGRPSNVSFAGRVDLDRVGTLGHSMGGGGVMQHVSDKRHGHWPKGVRVRAALGLAPTATWDNEPVTKVPLAVLWGTCDQVNTGEYVKWNKGRNKAPLHGITLTGGNHNYFNTQWSPSSRQVAGADDAVSGKRRGHCVSQDGRNEEHRALDETAERRIAAGYTVAFFRRYVRGDASQDALLRGEKELPGVERGVVDVEFVKPQ
ncbi:alpha/beta hydrolase [Streptomyces sp. NPDC041068]|uniref:alpha/beta hydrolase family protein n=1 Tax=Streptomyces sp. NPDC041068 TaxID=3155130 RepID=UPI0033E8A16F